MNVRDRFFSELYDRIQEGVDAMVVSSDLGAPSLDKFREDFPQRFVNTGIAEQNALAVASGLALTGKIAVAYGLNPFPVTRAFDHIRNLMASLKIPITVAALKAGTCTAEAGFSHMAIENISLLRTLHNIRIWLPSDETIVIKAVSEMVKNPVPGYIQFDPSISGELYSISEIDISKGYVVSGDDSDVAIVTYGIWAHRLKHEKLPARLFDCFSLPLDDRSFAKALETYKKIITIEDGVICGGIGSVVLEILNDYDMQIPVKRLALRFEQGYPSELSDRAKIDQEEGLTVEHLMKEIRG